MVAASKFYKPPLDVVHCSQVLLHPGRTCAEYTLDNAYRMVLSSAKYFLPIFLTPVLLKTNKANATRRREIIQSAFKHYVLTTLSASSASVLAFACVCYMRHLNGRWTKYGTIFIPALVAMQTAWIMPTRALRLFCLATSQTTLEAVLRHTQHSYALSRSLLHSKLAQTLLFMLNSGLILHCKRRKQYGGFWFMRPLHATPAQNGAHVESKSTPIKAASCQHFHAGQSCRKFVLSGIKSYLYYGVPLDLLSMMFKPVRSKGSLQSFLLAKLLSLRLNMTSFFLVYAGIYRLSTCLLANCLDPRFLDAQHFIAASLGGISYLCLSKTTFFTLSVVIAVQILWQKFCLMPSVPTKDQFSGLELLKRVPFVRIVVPLNVAIMCHWYIFEHQLVNSLGRKLLNAITAYNIGDIYDHLTRNSLEALMKEAGSIAAKGAF